MKSNTSCCFSVSGSRSEARLSAILNTHSTEHLCGVKFCCGKLSCPMKALVLFSLVVGSPPKLDALVAAANKKDPVELDRVARRLGAGRLLHGLSDASPEVRRAALEGAPRVDDCWTLLIPAARLISNRDDQVAQAAARAARR